MAKATKSKLELVAYEQVVDKIYFVRGQKVMLDFDLSILYEVETRSLNQAVKRNIDRFPEDFMFRLTEKEWNTMRSQIVIASEEVIGKQPVKTMRSQNVTASGSKRNTSATPYAFTEHGVTMLASVLKSERAVKMSIAVVRAFIELKKNASQFKELAEQLELIKDHIGQHDVQLNGIYQAIENMLDDKAEKQSWEDRKRIGFKS